MEFMKRHLGVLAAGLVIVGGTAFVATQQLAAAPSDGDTVTLAQDQQESPERPGSPDGSRAHRPGGFPKAIRGEVVVPAREGEGYATVRFDRGIVDHVDGTTLVITEDDGTSVEIPTTDETRVSRDGEDAELSDLQAGDHVATFRVKDGDAFVTKGVRAISPERWEEMQDRRDGMQERREGMRAKMREGMRERSEDRRASRDV
jgi:hypothetical protein